MRWPGCGRACCSRSAGPCAGGGAGADFVGIELRLRLQPPQLYGHAARGGPHSCAVRFLAKKSLLKVPFIGYHLKRAGHIPVPRGDARASLRTMTEAARTVRERGISVLVFPEGGRAPGAMREFKEGAAYIAIKARVPAVPVGIVGTRQILPMDSLLVRGGQVRLRIGAPIPTAGLTIHDHRQLTERLREAVAELVRE